MRIGQGGRECEVVLWERRTGLISLCLGCSLGEENGFD